VADPLVLVLGGTRSGKSRFGLERAAQLAGDAPVSVIVTARPGDPELDDRIARHRAQRPSSWLTIDAGTDLAAVIAGVAPHDTILIEGLMLWLATLAGDEAPAIDELLAGRVAAAVGAIESHRGPVVVVSDEIGLGMVPLDPAARAFRDLVGITHQGLAAAADEAYLLVAGLAVPLKGTR